MSPQGFIAEIQVLQDGLRRFLLALCCGNSMKADDLAQEALIKAYLGYESLRDGAALKSWIYRIAYHTFIDGERSIVVKESLEAAAGIIADSQHESDANFRYQSLHMALAQLAPQERSAILLYYFEGYSQKEIAEMTSQKENTVCQQLSRGRHHLKELLDYEQ